MYDYKLADYEEYINLLEPKSQQLMNSKIKEFVKFCDSL